jgi:hypothetical protein
VTRPEEALDRARAEAARRRAEGAYPPAEAGAAPPPELSTARLMEWAMIEPDPQEVRSLRPYGAPITAFKRMLVRLLVQYNSQLAAQQTRFNLALLSRVRHLEERLAELDAEGPPGDRRPS